MQVNTLFSDLSLHTDDLLDQVEYLNNKPFIEMGDSSETVKSEDKEELLQELMTAKKSKTINFSEIESEGIFDSLECENYIQNMKCFQNGMVNVKNWMVNVKSVKNEMVNKFKNGILDKLSDNTLSEHNTYNILYNNTFINNTSLNPGEKITLPFFTKKTDSIKRITAEILQNLISGKIKREFILIDSRKNYPNSHIHNAINIEKVSDLISIDPKGIIIFYSENSTKSVEMAKEFRLFDRSISEYPKLKYPEIYILEGGFKKFSRKYKKSCYFK